MSDVAFYLLYNCPKCDAEIFYGPCVTLLEHRGAPLVPADMVTQLTVDCDGCGTRTYLGDLDFFYEGADDEPAQPAG